MFKLIVSLGAGAFRTASLLVDNEYDISRSALAIGLAEGCEDCFAGPRKYAKRGCDRHLAWMRQRVHRMEDRVLAMLGDRAPATRHVRATVVFGADRQAEGRSTLYERTPGSMETGDPEEFGGAEGE